MIWPLNDWEFLKAKFVLGSKYNKLHLRKYTSKCHQQNAGQCLLKIQCVKSIMLGDLFLWHKYLVRKMIGDDMASHWAQTRKHVEMSL